MGSSTMISTLSREPKLNRRATIAALATVLGIALSANKIRAEDPPKRLGGNLVIAVFDSLPGIPAAIQFRSIMLVDPESGEQKNVGDRDLESGYLSPDGRFLAGVKSDREDQQSAGIWIYDVTGKTPPKRIFDRPGIPTWSGDSKSLVIGTQVARGKYETYRVNADGSGLTKLAVPESEFVVDWSRDGAWLASWNPVRKTKEIHHLLMHLDGTGSREIVNEDGAGFCFQISPDGREFVYATTKDTGRNATDSLWVVNTDGTGRRRLPLDFGARVMVRPRWSPDGSRLALGLRWNGKPPMGKSDQIVIINREGKELRTLPFPPTWRLELNDWK